MKERILMNADQLRALIIETVDCNTELLADLILNKLYSNGVQMNSEKQNTGAELRISMNIPASDKCSKLLKDERLLSADYLTRRIRGDNRFLLHWNEKYRAGHLKNLKKILPVKTRGLF